MYDLVVIGGGSGGVAAARRAAKYGAKVALIEANRLGGTCVNAGCVPKKIMWNAANVHEAITKQADWYNITLKPPTLDWAAFTGRRDAYLRRLNDIYAGNLSREGVTVFHGCHGYLLPGGEAVQLHRNDETTETVKAKYIIIATGSTPHLPTEVPGWELGLTSDGFFATNQQPQTVAIVGSGYIGVELAGVMAALGSTVYLLIRGNTVLTHFDQMIQDRLTGEMESNVRIVRQSNVTLLTKINDDQVEVEYETPEAKGTLKVDCLIWAIGRVPQSQGLEGIVACDQMGHVIVDEYQRTSIPTVHAVGDVTGKHMLTPVAIAAGRALCGNF